jgi:superfamily I DNA/RNA helicase
LLTLLPPPTQTTPAVRFLTPKQQEAVDVSPWTPLLVSAGPGSGKTLVAQERARALQRHLPSKGAVLYLSFTNAAVDEFIARIAVAAPHARIACMTLHSLLKCILHEPGNAELFGRKGNFNIFDDETITEVVEDVLSADEDLELAFGRKTAKTLVKTLISVKRSGEPSDNDFALLLEARPSRSALRGCSAQLTHVCFARRRTIARCARAMHSIFATWRCVCASCSSTTTSPPWRASG